MIRRVAKWAAALAMGGALATTAQAGPLVNFTGDVGKDMPTLGVGVASANGPAQGSIGQADWITQAGWTNGWEIKDVRFNYDKTSDTMQVGVNFYSIAGNPSGNPAGSDPRVGSSGGYAPADLGGRDSITLQFAGWNPNGTGGPGSPVIVAGVPEYKSSAYTGLDGFTVAAASSSPSIQTSYGGQINSAMGNLAFSPDPQHPDFEFTIKNWSQFYQLNNPYGFFVKAYAGSPDDVVAGETQTGWMPVKLGPQQTVVPEPASVAGWALVAAGAAWAARRKRATGQGSGA